MIEIKTAPIKNSLVTVPGSKSYTHRLLIAAALASGSSRILSPLRSEDTRFTAEGLRQLGIPVEDHGSFMTVHGTGGVLAPSGEIDLGNSGTSVRLLTGICALGKGPYTITGTKRMQERPIQDLLDGLTQLGVQAVSLAGNGCPPIEIRGGEIDGGRVDLNCKVSSQYLSSILLMAPLSRKGIDIRVSQGPVSKPYVDMTLEVMETLGIEFARDGYTAFRVPGGQAYLPGEYVVEPDASQAGYFWGAAAITGASITVAGLSGKSGQGDIKFAEVFAQMGCRVEERSEGICVTGGKLRGVTVDMADMPDMVPTLAVVAAFAEGTTEIRNVAHLKAKESDRFGAVVTELKKLGIVAECSDSGMTIVGGAPKGAAIHTYEDHRMAMSFSLAGLRVPGVFIENEACVSKSFPNYWDVFGALYV